jgi:putative sigma-54 modulation protein
METSDAIRDYVEEKCSKLTRFYDHIQSIEATLDFEADMPMAEIVVTAARKHTFVASHRDRDMYAAIDHCVDKITQQIRRFKDKVRDRQATPHSERGEA